MNGTITRSLSGRAVSHRDRPSTHKGHKGQGHKNRERIIIALGYLLPPLSGGCITPLYCYPLPLPAEFRKWG